MSDRPLYNEGNGGIIFHSGQYSDQGVGQGQEKGKARKII